MRSGFLLLGLLLGVTPVVAKKPSRAADTGYGASCLPEQPALGTDLYARTYGDSGATWRPVGCP